MRVLLLDTEREDLRRMEKEDVVMYNGILLSYKKKGDNAICSNMDAIRDYHTK